MATSKVSKEKIALAAEMAFDGVPQAIIAKKLGFTHQARISQMQKTEIWQQTVSRLETLKQKAQIEAEKRQQLLYASDSDRSFEQSRRMVQVCATTYSKLMQVINAGLDEAQSNSNKIAALEQIKHIPNLIKAALALQQETCDYQYDEIEALKVLANAGWLPRSMLKLANEQSSNMRSSLREALTGILPEYDEGQARGLTPETAAALRSYLFDIKPADISEISENLEPGSSSN
ncbi:hypothetical protein QT972_00265 [Microcoleus sp. herbarium7]|uniref:hypothetical protein n=1 Tax=Microcoleus sp. herbarium7 TaxID=3055435 RepID=UPI002FD31712